ncbi:unnamed protein product [Blepharisma stoltei]|uniref:Uncharacterized protein n=1 Tax=Blepharisma stoltei TaxID=1481888 RepID=A0AAU9IG02_9CILI|nr:unnamed protein product [Blepharisma stoltei]
MLDIRNLMPCYRDDLMHDELEEKIRWLAEKSESAQGSHILADCEFSNYLLETIEICEDFFPKLPTFLMSFNYKMSIEEEFMMHELSNYSQILHVICNQADDKTGWAAAATVLDSTCYWYRNQEQRIGNIIQGLMPRSQGNLVSAEMSGDFEYKLGPSGNEIYSLEFSRGDENCEAVPIPNGFPISFERENIKISANTGIYEFLEEFKQRPDHNHNRDELLETRNYLSSLKDNYML